MNAEAVVQFNQGVAFVLNHDIEFTYYKHGSLIIGLDPSCTFVKCYHYDRPTPGFQAFGGREFDIPLENGEVIHCNGQWWDGGYQKAAELLGEELVSVTYKEIKSLKECYVFYGACGVKSKIEEMKNDYSNKVYGYWEYEALLNGRDKPLR